LESPDGLGRGMPDASLGKSGFHLNDSFITFMK